MIVKLFEITDKLNKSTAIKKACDLLVESNITSKEYYDGVIAREKQASFYIGNFVAIPHAISDYHKYIKHNGLVIMRHKAGFDWDGEKVHYIIGIAALGEKQIDVLSNIANCFCEEELVLESLNKSLAELGKEFQWE